MDEKFNEYSEIGQKIQDATEFMLLMVMKHYDITFKEPPHDIARRLLNEIVEFESEAVQDQRARKRAAGEARENGG
jgi:hypothetical protein